MRTVETTIITAKKAYDDCAGESFDALRHYYGNMFKTNPDGMHFGFKWAHMMLVSDVMRARPQYLKCKCAAETPLCGFFVTPCNTSEDTYMGTKVVVVDKTHRRTVSEDERRSVLYLLCGTLEGRKVRSPLCGVQCEIIRSVQEYAWGIIKTPCIKSEIIIPPITYYGNKVKEQVVSQMKPIPNIRERVAEVHFSHNAAMSRDLFIGTGTTFAECMCDALQSKTTCTNIGLIVDILIAAYNAEFAQSGDVLKSIANTWLGYMAYTLQGRDSAKSKSVRATTMRRAAAEFPNALLKDHPFSIKGMILFLKTLTIQMNETGRLFTELINSILLHKKVHNKSTATVTEHANVIGACNRIKEWLKTTEYRPTEDIALFMQAVVPVETAMDTRKRMADSHKTGISGLISYLETKSQLKYDQLIAIARIGGADVAGCCSSQKKEEACQDASSHIALDADDPRSRSDDHSERPVILETSTHKKQKPAPTPKKHQSRREKTSGSCIRSSSAQKKKHRAHTECSTDSDTSSSEGESDDSGISSDSKGKHKKTRTKQSKRHHHGSSEHEVNRKRKSEQRSGKRKKTKV